MPYTIWCALILNKSTKKSSCVYKLLTGNDKERHKVTKWRIHHVFTNFFHRFFSNWAFEKKRTLLIIQNSFSQFKKYSYIWNSRFVKTSDEFVIHWNEIEMGRVPNCESMLVHKTNQIMTNMRSFSKPLTDLPIRKWVVVFLTCSCLNILTNSIITIKKIKNTTLRALCTTKKSWIIIEIKIQT